MTSHGSGGLEKGVDDACWLSPWRHVAVTAGRMRAARRAGRAVRAAGPVAAAPAPRPMPPGGASATFVTPALLADGSYDTPNRALTPAATAWHLRAALNVAALRCNDEALVANYNALVRAHGAALARAHDAAMQEAGSQAAFDCAMTRLYNYFALPPVQASFCAAAATIADEAARTPPAEFARFVDARPAGARRAVHQFLPRIRRSIAPISRAGRRASQPPPAPRLLRHRRAARRRAAAPPRCRDRRRGALTSSQGGRAI